MKLVVFLTACLFCLDVAAMLAGCSSQTEGEKTIAKASQLQDAGEMIRQGEMFVANGKATEARGEAIRKQGDSIEGDRLVGEGKADQKKGEELISQGRKIRDKVR